MLGLQSFCFRDEDLNPVLCNLIFGAAFSPMFLDSFLVPLHRQSKLFFKAFSYLLRASCHSSEMACVVHLVALLLELGTTPIAFSAREVSIASHVTRLFRLLGVVCR
jgi:hypothetical protein